MNFFEHQEKARKKTALLIFLFGLAVALIIVAIYFAVWFGLMSTVTTTEAGAPGAVRLWDPFIFAAVAVCVLLFIGLASGFKTLSLRKGGSAVA